MMSREDRQLLSKRIEREQLRRQLIVSALAGSAFRVGCTGGVYEPVRVDELTLGITAKAAVMLADRIVAILEEDKPNEKAETET